MPSQLSLTPTEVSTTKRDFLEGFATSWFELKVGRRPGKKDREYIRKVSEAYLIDVANVIEHNLIEGT